MRLRRHPDTSSSGGGTVAPAGPASRAAHDTRHLPIAMAGIALLALVLRVVRLGRSWEIFVDEVTYLRLSQSVAQHLSVRLYGELFFLHPPAFFFLEGAYLRVVDWLVGTPDDPVRQTLDVRYLNVVLATLTAAALVYLGTHLAGRTVGIVTGLLFALDSFIIRMNSRNYLDTSAIMWVVFGLCLLIPAIPMAAAPGRVTWKRQAAVSLMFGLALLTKDMMAFLTLVPLGICWLLGLGIPRRAAAGIGIGSVLVYAVYPLATWWTGNWSVFVDQKLRGVSRFSGHVQETGFNQAGGPSFAAALLGKADLFATTYALIGLGAPALLLLFFWGPPRARVMAVWTACSYAMVAYSGLFGTFEEQFFYFLVVPSILSCTLAGWQLLQPCWGPRFVHRLRTPMRVLAVAALILFTCWNGFVWTRIHLLESDNGSERAIAYLHQHAPVGSLVGVTYSPMQFLLTDYRIEMVLSAEQLRFGGFDYVVVSENLIRQGYSDTSVDVLDWLQANATPVYRFHGRGIGDLVIYQITSSPPSTTAPPAS